MVEDKIIPWQNAELQYKLGGFQSNTVSMYSTNINDTTKVNIPSVEREVLLYVPQYTYKIYAKDLSIINELPNDKYIELAISFDKGYSLSKVKEMLPKFIHQTWYWINSYPMENEVREEPEFGQWLYGISQPSSELGEALSTPEIKTESDFLEHIKKIDKNEYQFFRKQQKLAQVLKHK